ncbi:hypothetical protein [Chryseobacterium sp. GP-SGM7]|uniref:hypothetical protein n=1 Tax=Chryseobacterium sp. GP-SGM7 TaxID=3411323 RepID=UPI003B922FFF
MKKLFFIAAFSAVGMLSAKDNRKDVCDYQDVCADKVQYTLMSAKLPAHDWLEVETWCGKVFYLDNNHYSSFEQIAADANYFTDQQCGPYPG